MPVYGIEMKLCGTLYVKAKSKRAAMALAKAQKDEWLEVRGEDISDRKYDDPELPEVSWSGAITCHGVWPGAVPDEN